MHLPLDTAETLPTKPDEASHIDFGLRETERFKGDAQALHCRRDNE